MEDNILPGRRDSQTFLFLQHTTPVNKREKLSFILFLIYICWTIGETTWGHLMFDKGIWKVWEYIFINRQCILIHFINKVYEKHNVSSIIIQELTTREIRYGSWN